MLHPKELTIRLAAIGSLALAAIVPHSASAALVTGQATITMDNTAFAQSSVNVGQGYLSGWIVNTFWDSSYNTTGITGASAPGTVLPASGSTAMVFPVNSNTTTISYPAAGPWGRTVQATTMDAGNTPSGQIGLSGGWLLTGDQTVSGSTSTKYLTPYDFSLTNSGGTWNIRSFDTGFGYQNFLTLANVSQSLDLNGQLLLSGDLKWTGLWASLIGANASAVVGHFSLAPVPVPAAVWLFGSAMAGLLGIARRKAKPLA